MQLWESATLTGMVSLQPSVVVIPLADRSEFAKLSMPAERGDVSHSKMSTFMAVIASTQIGRH